MEYSAAKLVLETLHTYGELNVYCDGHGCRHVFLADPDDPRTVLLVQAEEGPPSLRTYCPQCFESLLLNIKQETRKEDKPMYDIEKNVPVSPKIYGGGPRSIYPFIKMEIGDSFLVPCGGPDKLKTRNRVNSSLRHYIRDGRKFSIRNVQDGVRCWRVA